MSSIFSRLGFVVCLCFSFLLSSRGGIPVDTSLKVQIRWLQSPWKLPSPLQYQTTNHLTQWLKLRGITIVDKADRLFWCDDFFPCRPEKLLFRTSS